MSHQDGRCASDAETIIVSTGGTLPTSVPSGKRLLVVRDSVTGSITWNLSGSQMTIVGQESGTITGNGTSPTLHATGGDLYIRDLTLTGGAPGIMADGGSILHLDHVSASSNASGGILLDGAGFDIKNTTVKDNAAAGGDPGIRIQNAPTSSTTPKSLSLCTVSGNAGFGISCTSGTVATASGVLVTGNGGTDITSFCGFTSCSSAGPTCGAQQ